MRRNTLSSLLLVSILLTNVVRAASPDAPTYPTTFKVAPLQALTQAAALPGRSSKKPVLTAREYSLLQDAAVGRMGRWVMADAALVIAGVPEGPKHDQLVARLDEIAAQCEQLTANATTAEEKAKIVARYLNKEPLKAGYVSGQYDIVEMLETGHYNCVSSAILFNMMAQRLGLEAVAVQVPRHVFSRVGDVDVEPTSGRVYPATKRPDRYTKERKDSDEKEGAPYAHRLSKETDNLGLLAEVYYDEGCDHGEKETEYADAIISYLKAACVDADNPNVARNMKSAFKSWFNHAVDTHNFGEAMMVARFYRQILRDPSDADAMMRRLQTQVASR